MKYSLFAIALLFASQAMAETITQIQDNNCQSTCGAKLTAKAGNVPSWTGWIYAAGSRALVFDVSFTDTLAVDSTAITMRCESSSANSTANDAGYDIHGAVVSCVSPACTTATYPNTWTTPPPASASTVRHQWTVNNIPNKYLNCYFAITGGVAAESYSVSVRGVSP